MRKLFLLTTVVSSFVMAMSVPAWAEENSPIPPKPKAPDTTLVEKAPPPAEVAPKVEAPAPQNADASHSSEANPSIVKFNSTDVWNADLFNRDDNKVLVIQDRKYTKAGKYEVDIHVASSDGSFVHNTYGGGLNLLYHFSEYLGVEVFGNYSSSYFNQDGKQLNDFLTGSGFTSIKEFQAPKLFAGAALMWSPIYGKFAFFRESIIHFDVYGLLGASVLTTDSNRTTETQVHPGSLLGLGFRVYLTKNVSIRFDLRNNVFRSTFQATYTNGGALIAPETTVWRTQYQFQFGTGILFDMFGGGA